MEITLKDLVEVNKRLGGDLRSDSSLSFAESMCRNNKSAYRKVSVWTRAIVVDHPFTDANKRTALYVIAELVSIKTQKKMARAIERIASKNITDLKKLEEMIKNANK